MPSAVPATPEPAERVRLEKWRQDIQLVLTFLEQAEQWDEKVSPILMRETLESTIRRVISLYQSSVDFVRSADESASGGVGETILPILSDAVKALGVELRVSDDQMRAAIRIPEEHAVLWDVDSVIKSVSEQGVCHGFDESAVKRIFSEIRYGRFVAVARGTAPVAGKDAILKKCLKIHHITGIPKPVSKCKVDLKNLQRFEPIRAGQVIVRKIPVEPGVSGSDVLGNVSPCFEGQDAVFPSISNTRVSEDGLCLESAVDGVAYMEGEELVLVEALDFPKGINYETGNIRTEVTVSITGDVLSGFHVESSGDILVKGTVEAAFLISKGNIVVEGGVEGGSLIAKKNIDVKFLNQAKINAGLEVCVHGSAIQSAVMARRVCADGNQAHIVGGNIHAWDDVSAAVIGSYYGAKTDIRLGEELNTLPGEIARLDMAIHRNEERLERFKTAGQELERLRKNGELPEWKKGPYESVKKGIEKASKTLKELRLKRDELQTDLKASQKAVRMVRASDGIQPGVIIHIQDAVLRVANPYQEISLCLVGETIAELPFQEREDIGTQEESDASL